jgi:hypothetical protein
MPKFKRLGPLSPINAQINDATTTRNSLKKLFIGSRRLKPSNIIFISIVLKFWILNINLAQFHAISQAQKKAPKSLHFHIYDFLI